MPWQCFESVLPQLQVARHRRISLWRLKQVQAGDRGSPRWSWVLAQHRGYQLKAHTKYTITMEASLVTFACKWNHSSVFFLTTSVRTLRESCTSCQVQQTNLGHWTRHGVPGCFQPSPVCWQCQASPSCSRRTRKPGRCLVCHPRFLYGALFSGG